ncbi:MAG TPA: alpha-2-macroglobulin family protein, partial [Gemmataceae bacterium]|nr:alpha-2-macroglobulin family protein [Gemmataceae bacterium]
CGPTAGRALLVGAYCRGRLLDHQMITTKKGEWAEVALRPSSGAGGVYRITVFEDLVSPDAARRRLVPRAERLVYRRPAETLKLTVAPHSPQYTPGERVALTVTAHDEHDRPTAAVVLLSAVDQRTLTMADEKTARGMPTHFLLTTEVRKPEDLEYADFLLSSEPKAAQTLDLLLGTQGWRRFMEQNPGQFKERLRKDERLSEDAERLLVTTGQSSTKVTDYAREEEKRVAEEYAGREKELQDEHVKSLAAAARVRDDESAAAARLRLNRYDDWLDRYGRLAAPAATVLLFVLVLAALFLTLPRSATRSAGFAVGAVLCGLVLLAVSLVPLLREADGDRAAMMALGEPKAQRQLAQRDAPRAAPAPTEAPAMPAPPPPGPLAPDVKPGAVMAAKPAAPKVPAEVAKGLEAKKADAAPHGDENLMKRAADKMGRAADLGLAGGKKQNAAREREQLGGEARQLRELQDARPGFGGAGGRGPVGGALPPAMRGGGFGGGRFADRMEKPAQEPPLPPLVVREYAHANTSPPGQVRTDFAETLLWQPALVIPADGRKDVSFQLCDSVTNFAVRAEGYTLDGRLGTAAAAVESRLPFTLDPKTPIEISSADRVDLPVTVRNNTADGRAVTVRLAVTSLGLEGKADPSLTLATSLLNVPGNTAVRHLYPFRPKVVEGSARVEVSGETVPFAADRIARTFAIVPDGFPVVGSKSDLLEGTAVNDVALPETWVKGTLKCRVQVYPSTLAALQQGLEAMLREPNGCFEQTSTTNYPNVLILDYLKETDQARPEVESRARDLLKRGYQKLTAFECPKTATSSKQGYEWFGAPDGAHEALTAYGLLQFRDMARVQDVDPVMLERTRQYLLSQRDGKGGFKRNPRAI